MLLLALLALGSLAAWWLRGRPQPVPAAPAEPVQCVSYAPFRQPGETPFDPRARVDEQRIAADLAILAQRTRCVRTYSVQQGLDAVPRVARRLGMTVLLGIWLGRDRAENAAEMELGLRLAREHADVVRALVVGNEVLLRRELSEADLTQHLARARREAPVPVTYADVWEFWLTHPRVAESVSFVTVHILPYWEDEPVGVKRALAHVLDIHERVRAAFVGRDILIGETGWPSAGRARRDAVPGRVEQARFVRGFLAAAQAQGLRYNLIEAFDQPWKRRLEGAMGGHWGLFDSAGQEKFAWSGPLAQDPRWTDGWIGAAVGALGFVALAAARRRGRRALLIQALAGLATGAVLVAQWRYMVDWNRDALEWGVTAAYTALAGALAWITAERLSDPGGIDASAALAQASRQLHFAFLFGAAVMSLLLAFDPRYRGFAWPLYAIPAASAVLLAAAGERLPGSARQHRLLALVIAAASVPILVMERPSNPQLWAWLLVAGCLAARAAGFGQRGRPAARFSAIAPSSTPTAEGSKQ